MKKYNTSANLIRVNKHIHVLFDGSVGDKQQLESDRDVYSHPPSSRCIWKRVMIDALEDHEGIVSISGREITNFRFADSIDGLAEEEELAKLVERLDKTSTAFGMEISAEMT